MTLTLLAVFLSIPAMAQNAPAPYGPPAPPVPVAANSQDGEFTAFDLIAGGSNYGSVYGRFGEGWFEPDTPGDILPILPAVRNPEDFLPLFTGRIQGLRTVRGVGTVHVDSSNFRLVLDIERGQTLLASVGKLGDLEGSEKNFALSNTLFVAGSASTETFDLTDNVSAAHDTVLSRRSLSLRSSGTMTKDDYILRNALVRRDFKAMGQTMTAEGGLLGTGGGMRFAKNLDYMGLRLATNQNLIFHDQQLQGSNLEIFLPRRAQVQVYRGTEAGGEVLYSRILDFGTVQLDTRAFPQGSYDIEIVVRDGGTVVSRETRAFTKTQNLPPYGKPLISVEGGELREDLDAEGTPVVSATNRMRLSDSIGGGIGVAATGDDSVYEASLSSQKSLTLLGALGMLETSLTGAFAQSFEPAGAEATASWSSPAASFSLRGSKIYRRPDVAGKRGSLALSDRQAMGLNFSMPVMLKGYRFYTSFSAETSRSSSEGKKHHYGPSASYSFAPVRGYVPSLKIEQSTSETDNRILATFSVRNEDPVWRQNFDTDASRIGHANDISSRFTFGYSGRGSDKASGWRKNLDANIGLRLAPLLSNTQDTAAIVSGDAQYTGRFARLKSYLEQNIDESSGQAGGELESTMLWSPGAGVTATSQGASGDVALVMVTLKGAEGAEIDLTVNGIPRASGRAGETAVLSIPAYTQVLIGARDREGKGGLRVKEKNQAIVGYPGNVAYRQFTIVRAWVIMGTLADEAGAPLKNARFTLNGGVYYTDDTGFFTLEEGAAPGERLAFEGWEYDCATTVPELPKEETLLDLGNISCAKKPPA